MGENKRFIMLGERGANGRIVKNESYTLDEFMDKIDCRVDKTLLDRLKEPVITLVDRLFKIKLIIKLAVLENISRQKALKQSMDYVRVTIEYLIKQDNFGKKKK